MAAILPLSLSYYFIQVSSGSRVWAGAMAAAQLSLHTQRYFANSMPMHFWY
jgi:hypothetical protein